MLLDFMKLSPHASLPEYGSIGAVGMDLRALCVDKMGEPYCMVVAPGERALIKTGLAVAIPVGFYGRIAPRSGLAVKKGVDVLAGVIDPDYRGELGIVIINHGNENFNVWHEDRVAQLIIEQCARPALRLVEDLDITKRGAGSFGSTGL